MRRVAEEQKQPGRLLITHPSDFGAHVSAADPPLTLPSVIVDK